MTTRKLLNDAFESVGYAMNTAAELPMGNFALDDLSKIRQAIHDLSEKFRIAMPRLED